MSDFTIEEMVAVIQSKVETEVGTFAIDDTGIKAWSYQRPKPDDAQIQVWVDERRLANSLKEKEQHKLNLLTEEVSGWLVERHLEQKEMTGHSTSLSEAEFQELLVWRQALRDVHFTTASDTLPPPPNRVVRYINDKLHVHHPDQPKHDLEAPHHQIITPVG